MSGRVLLNNVKAFNEIPSKSSRFLPISLDFIMKGGQPYLHEHLKSRHDQLGPIVRERMGPYDLVSIVEPKMIRSMILGEDKYPKPTLPAAWLHYLETKNIKRGLFFETGDKWLQTRRIMDKVLLDSDKVNKLTSGVLEVANDLLDLWSRKSSSESQSSFILEDYFLDLSKWSIETIAYMMFGHRLNSWGRQQLNIQANSKAIEFVKHANEMLASSAELHFLPVELAQKLNLQKWRRFENSMDQLIKLGHELSSNLLTSASHDSLVFHMMSMDNKLDHIDLLKNLTDFLIAAADTTASSVSWALYLLSINPLIQKRVRDEVLNSMDKHRNQLHSLPKSLVYLSGFVRETMRLYPPAPFISRNLTKDTVLGGYNIPANTIVVYPVIITGRMESHFEQAHHIDPDRWSSKQQSDSLCPMRLKSEKLASMPFGLGPRMCIGRNMALLEINMLLASILSKYEISKVETEPVNIKLRLTTWPDRPIKLLFNKI